VTVTDNSGAVVSGVRVEALRRHSREAATPRVTRGRTNKAGGAVLNLDLPGRFDVLADAPGYESKVEMLSVAPGCTYPLNIQLPARAIECPIYFR
jgi:hypothetical protein